MQMLILSIGSYVMALYSALTGCKPRDTFYWCVMGFIEVLTWASNTSLIGLVFILILGVWKVCITPLRVAKDIEKKSQNLLDDIAAKGYTIVLDGEIVKDPKVGELAQYSPHIHTDNIDKSKKIIYMSRKD